MVGNNDLCIKYNKCRSNTIFKFTILFDPQYLCKKKNHFFPTSTSMAVQVNNFQWELIFHCLLQTTKKLWSFMIIKCNKWNYQLSKIFLLIMALWKTRYLRWGRSIFLSKTHVSCWKIQNNQQLFSFIMWTFAIIVYSKLLSNCWLGTYTHCSSILNFVS